MYDAKGKTISEHALLIPKSWRFQTQVIHQLIITNHIVTTVIGASCGGKTSFAKILSQNIEPFLKTLVFHSDNTVEETDFKKALCLTFNENEENSLQEIIESLHRRSKPVLCIIDDAHLLSLSILEVLFNSMHLDCQQSGFHLCLIGDDSIEPLLRNLQNEAFDDSIHTMNLGTLTIEETRTYALQQLKQTQGKRWFKPERLNAFYEMTAGEFSRMNEEWFQFIQSSPFVHGEWRDLLSYKKLLPMSFLFLVSLVSFFWCQQESSSVKMSAYNNIPPILGPSLGPSEIPPFTLGARRHGLGTSPFQRELTKAELDTDDLDMVVRDRVLVIPKAMYRHKKV